METEKIINIISDLITAVSSLVIAGLAVYGVLWEWKKQMRGKTEYDIARRYLKTALQLRDAMRFVRNPFISLEEMETALKENGFSSEDYKDNQKTNRAVYSTRWKKIMEARTNMEAELLEAEVSWGIDARKAQESLNKLVIDLYISLKSYLDGHSKMDEKGRELIYDLGEEDEFSKKVASSIKEIEDFLKPYLK